LTVRRVLVYLQVLSRIWLKSWENQQLKQYSVILYRSDFSCKIVVEFLERSAKLNNEIKVDTIGKENIAELLKNESQLYLTLLERMTELIKNSKK